MQDTASDASLAAATQAVLVQTQVVHQLLDRGEDAREAQGRLDRLQFELVLLERRRSQLARTLAEIHRQNRAWSGQRPIAGRVQGADASPAAPWASELSKVQVLLELYGKARLRNRCAQWDMVGAGARAADPRADGERLRGLGLCEQDALVLLLDEMARCARQCQWPAYDEHLFKRPPRRDEA